MTIQWRVPPFTLKTPPSEPKSPTAQQTERLAAAVLIDTSDAKRLNNFTKVSPFLSVYDKRYRADTTEVIKEPRHLAFPQVDDDMKVIAKLNPFF